MNDKASESVILRAAELLRERAGGSPPLCEQKVRDLVMLLDCLEQALTESEA